MFLQAASIIRRFQTDLEDGQVKTLRESARCTGHILQGAQAIVSKLYVARSRLIFGSTQMSDETTEIRRDVEESGFPLEIETSLILKRNGWKVRNQAYYLDEDERKGRTVDIIGFKAFHETLGNYDRLHVSLVIDCKRSSKPWVFYTAQKERELIHLVGIVKHYAKPQLKNFRWLAKSHYSPTKLDEQAIIAYEPFKKGKGQAVFRATNQVTKATAFEIRQMEDFAKKIPMRPVFFIYPVICFDGSLYKCTLKEGGIEVESVDYLQYWVHWRDFYLIDVVKKESLPDFLTIMDEEIEAQRQCLKQ